MKCLDFSFVEIAGVWCLFNILTCQYWNSARPKQHCHYYSGRQVWFELLFENAMRTWQWSSTEFTLKFFCLVLTWTCMFQHDPEILLFAILIVHILYTKPMWERERNSCVKLFLKHILMLRGVNQLWYSSTNLMPYVHAAIIGKFCISLFFVCVNEILTHFHRRENESRIVGQLLTLMDGNKKSSKILPHIVVVASTNRSGHATLLIP